MAKVIMTCGRICCGKSTYARKIKAETKAVILSIDEMGFKRNSRKFHAELSER